MTTVHKLIVYAAEIRLLIKESQYGRAKVIYKGEESLTEEIQWFDLEIALAKMVDALLQMQGLLQEINFGTNEEPSVTYHSSLLPVDLKQKLIELLKEFKDCFMQDYNEMSRLNKKLIKHYLPIKLGYKPYLQP